MVDSEYIEFGIWGDKEYEWVLYIKWIGVIDNRGWYGELWDKREEYSE